jgi:crotonobetainyl-CoA:carnitine CoA-transferase CaiB-like acyl-CoA transferase
MPLPRASQALSRFTVLDLTRVRSGPIRVRQLADRGANVIKIDALMDAALTIPKREKKPLIPLKR